MVDCSKHARPSYGCGWCEQIYQRRDIEKLTAEIERLTTAKDAVYEAALVVYRKLDGLGYESVYKLEDALNSVQTRLSKLHPDCRGPWERGDTNYPTGEHITDCDKCLEWNRHPDRHSAESRQDTKSLREKIERIRFEAGALPSVAQIYEINKLERALAAESGQENDR